MAFAERLAGVAIMKNAGVMECAHSVTDRNFINMKKLLFILLMTVQTGLFAHDANKPDECIVGLERELKMAKEGQKLISFLIGDLKALYSTISASTVENYISSVADFSENSMARIENLLEVIDCDQKLHLYEHHK